MIFYLTFIPERADEGVSAGNGTGQRRSQVAHRFVAHDFKHGQDESKIEVGPRRTGCAASREEKGRPGPATWRSPGRAGLPAAAVRSTTRALLHDSEEPPPEKRLPGCVRVRGREGHGRGPGHCRGCRAGERVSSHGQTPNSEARRRAPSPEHRVTCNCAAAHSIRVALPTRPAHRCAAPRRTVRRTAPRRATARPAAHVPPHLVIRHGHGPAPCSPGPFRSGGTPRASTWCKCPSLSAKRRRSLPALLMSSIN
jgi:hypothetical protein